LGSHEVQPKLIRLSNKMEFVAIYMRGQMMKVPTGSVLDMSKDGEGPENKVSVKVQGIEFVVSRAMIYAKSKILTTKNFFTNALDFYDTRHTTIEISRDSAPNDVSHLICVFVACFFILIGYFLDRRLQRLATILCCLTTCVDARWLAASIMCSFMITI